MGRITLAIILAGVLAGCSASTGGVHHDPEKGAEGSVLVGVTSEYSIRLAELPRYDELEPDSSMREGLVAGDKAVHIAVAAYEVKPFLGLDLIVNNRQSAPLEIDRSDVRLVDSKGRWLSPVDDFPGAERYGLRSRSYHPDPNVPYDGLGLYDPETEADAVGYATSSSSGGKGSSQVQVGNSSRVIESGPVYLGWNEQPPVAPQILRVPGHEGRGWWLYWRYDHEPAFPLTAFVTVEGRHMIYVFDKK